MKKIKLILATLFISSISFAQTDTIIRMVAGKCYAEFNDDNILIYSTDKKQIGDYKDFVIKIEKNQILLLHLYDSCKRCDQSIQSRTLLLSGVGITKKPTTVSSSDNVYYINGKGINEVIVRIP